MSKQDRSKARTDRKLTRKTRRNSSNEPLVVLVKEQADKRHVAPVRKIVIKPLNEAQGRYDAAMVANQITFGVGPAGTGKTWMAAMRAAEALVGGHIQKIIVTRPAVEAGESLGFMPGELEEKYEPYFRPVRDALVEYLGSGQLEYLMKSGAIEARPLAFLRGATIKNAWLIADEMQNATITQMKMLLTRIGYNSKFIVNGDPDQCDLPDASKSGLRDAVRRMCRVGGCGSVVFTENDVVRSGMAQQVVKAYSNSRVSTDAQSYNTLNDNSSNDNVLNVEQEADGLKRVFKWDDGPT